MLLQGRIKQIREHFGLSQAHFAQRINKSPGFISLVETGRSNASDDTIKSICSAFSINESLLRNGEGEMTMPCDILGLSAVDQEIWYLNASSRRCAVTVPDAANA